MYAMFLMFLAPSNSVFLWHYIPSSVRTEEEEEGGRKKKKEEEGARKKQEEEEEQRSKREEIRGRSKKE